MTCEIVIVLGMHRSGTSCLAGMLEGAGLHLGEVNTAAPHNKKGNREHLDIMKLNDQVLANTGHSWRNPPDGQAQWSDADRRRRDDIIASFADSVPWGFKDPRTLLTLEGWLEALPSACFAGTFRNPRLVAMSLASRPGPLHVPIEDGLGLWADYNRRLLDLHDRRPFAMVSFDLSPDDYTQRVKTICAEIGLDPDKAGEFFEESLRASNDADEIAVPREVDDLFEALLAKSL